MYIHLYINNRVGLSRAAGMTITNAYLVVHCRTASSKPVVRENKTQESAGVKGGGGERGCGGGGEEGGSEVASEFHWIYLEDAGNVAGTRSAVRQFHDLLPRRVRQRTPVHEHAAQLVNAAMSCQCERRQQPARTTSVAAIPPPLPFCLHLPDRSAARGRKETNTLN